MWALGRGGAPAPCRAVALGPRTQLHAHSLKMNPKMLSFRANREFRSEIFYSFERFTQSLALFMESKARMVSHWEIPSLSQRS